MANPDGRPTGTTAIEQELRSSGLSLAKFAARRAKAYTRGRGKLVLNRWRAMELALCVDKRTVREYRERANDGVEPFFTLFEAFSAAEMAFRESRLAALVPQVEKKSPHELMVTHFPDLSTRARERAEANAYAREQAAEAIVRVAERFENEVTGKPWADEAREVLNGIVSLSLAVLDTEAGES